VRAGATLRAAAKHHGVSAATALRWVRRAGATRLDRLKLASCRPGPRRSPRRTSDAVEELVVRTRRELRETSALGEHGAKAVRRAMTRAGVKDPPSVRTIGRILRRRGMVEPRRRVRRPPPPRGWYLPDVAAARAELDGFDVITDLSTLEDKRIEVLTGQSLHGREPLAEVRVIATARIAAAALTARWKALGLPSYAQFDNDTRFTGANFRPDVVGRVIRLCLSLGVVPVFSAPREHGFQNFVEGFNARWKKGVRGQFRPTSLAATQRQSDLFVAAFRAEHGRGAAPARRAFPSEWKLDLQLPLRGRIVFIRRADDLGRVRVLLRHYDVDRAWAQRLVRCELDYDRGELRCFGLSRSHPAEQPLLRVHPYAPPPKRRPVRG
jgi:transposase-like protein